MISSVSATPAKSFASGRSHRMRQRREQAAHLRVLEAHHLGRPAGHAGRCLEGREQHFLFGGEMRLHLALEAAEPATAFRPASFLGQCLGLGEQVVAMLVMDRKCLSGRHDDVS